MQTHDTRGELATPGRAEAAATAPLPGVVVDAYGDVGRKRRRDDEPPEAQRLGPPAPIEVPGAGSGLPTHLDKTPPPLPHSPAQVPRKSTATIVFTEVPTVSSPVTPSTPLGANGGRLEKWSLLLSKALLTGVDAEGEGSQLVERAMAVAREVAVAIPGSREESADTLRCLVSNLRDPQNSALRENVLSGRLAVNKLVRMSESDLANPELRRQREAAFLERSRDTDLTEMRKALTTKSTLFRCPACKARDCSWTQRQTRSGDEPMTIFCRCNQCGHNWKKY